MKEASPFCYTQYDSSWLSSNVVVVCCEMLTRRRGERDREERKGILTCGVLCQIISNRGCLMSNV